MVLFWHDFFHHTFLQYALLGGLLASISCGVIGGFIVARRITYIAGAIAHSVLAGMGAALYLHRVHGVEWLTPIMGATFAAIIAALIIAFVTLYTKQREDTVVSAVWAIGMAIGISFIAATPGYSQNLMTYLFGNILMIGKSDLEHMLVLDIIILIIVFLFYNRFLIISFQPELAVLRGIKSGFYHTLLLILIALTVVVLSQVVGLIMVIALLTLPAATSFKIVQRLWTAMVLACALCLIFIVSGIIISYEPELPPSATIIEIAGVFYLLILCMKSILDQYKKKKVKEKNQHKN